MLDRGEVNQRDLAARFVITPARVSQVLALLRLHPSIIAFLRAHPLTTERRLRPLLSLNHADQLRAAPGLVTGWNRSLAPSRRRSRRGSRR